MTTTDRDKCVCGEAYLPPEGFVIEGLYIHRYFGPCYLIDYKEPQLGCATTQELMEELITRFQISAKSEDFWSSVNFLRAQTLWNILYGMEPETKAYRTIDN